MSLKSEPIFSSERDAIRDAKTHLGAKAKKGLAYTTYTEGGKWGWVNDHKPWERDERSTRRRDREPCPKKRSAA